MSTNLFSIKSHTIPCSHIRQYPRATLSGKDDVLQLAVKQYTPLSNPNPSPGDVTILSAHANGFPKELYEPLWDELLPMLEARGVRIRSIWIADVAWQGYSGELNEHLLGNDPYWTDHARDLFLLVNRFRDEFVHPIVGVGHSLGGNNLINLALMHPRLMYSLVLVDPVAAGQLAKQVWLPAKSSVARRDLWPSREDARKAFSRSKFFQAWDPRVLDRWVEHGLRDLPTAVYPEGTEVKDAREGARPVTLRTTKHNEVFTFVRPNFPKKGEGRATLPDRRTHPDFHEQHYSPANTLYRHEVLDAFSRLHLLRPTVLYVFGDKSDLSAPPQRADKMAVTGTGPGGNGGAKLGRTKEVVLDAGHLIPMEKTVECARQVAVWLKQEVGRWKVEERQWQEDIERTPPRDRFTMSKDLVDLVNKDWKQNNALSSKL